MLPRITRAQSMDILSSQANLAGYKAVVVFQLMKEYSNDDDCSRNNPSSKSIGCWGRCCGLQAIATAKRMGAVVFATDVRMASKEH